MKKMMVMMFSVLVVAAMLVVPAAGAANGNGGGGGQVSSKDKVFLVGAMQTDLMEIKSGEVAMKQGKSQGVVKLGELLARAHSKLLGAGGKLARELGVPVPKTPSATMMQKMKALASKTGSAFDRAYAKMMVMGHEEAIEKATNEIQAGSNKLIVAVAKKDVPIYEQHLRDAEKVMKELR
jgi:putative membrane protein